MCSLALVSLCIFTACYAAFAAVKQSQQANDYYSKQKSKLCRKNVRETKIMPLYYFLKEIVHYKPDVICLQEVDIFEDLSKELFDFAISMENRWCYTKLPLFYHILMSYNIANDFKGDWIVNCQGIL